MDALTALQQRVSCAKLTEPSPSTEQLQAIYRTALRAAYHGNLKPWRFLTVSGTDREALGDVYLQAARQDNPALSDAQCQRYRQMPLRAPVIVVAIARCCQHPKVPESEQLIAAGAAVQNMLNAAFAQGVGAYWRTGELAYHDSVRSALGLEQNEHIIGYLYLGTPAGRQKTAPEPVLEDFFSPWPG